MSGSRLAARRSSSHVRNAIGVALALLSLLHCVGVVYQRPGRQITAHEGKTLVFGRLRFFLDGDEFFPWKPELFPASGTERHVWLLRLGGRAVTAELHPDADGSLTIWLAHGDYALVGSTTLPSPGSAPYEVVALLRVPAGPIAAYAGELILEAETHEGWHASSGEFGMVSVALAPIDSARAMLEHEYGPMSEAPAVSAWCAGNQLPAFDDPNLGVRARDLLDHECGSARPGAGIVDH